MTQTNHSDRLRVLLIEDNSADAELEIAELKRGGIDLSYDIAQTGPEVSSLLDKNAYDVILADYNLPYFSGMEALDILREKNLSTPLILVTGALQSDTAVECVKQGASDYVLKQSLTRLPLSVRRALDETRLREERRRAEEALARKVDELARSNADLEQFAYVASHDLQEPLRMVAAYTQLLSERYRGKLDENADKYIGYAVEGAVRMQTLVSDLLAFSRVGRNGLERTSVNCDLALDEALINLTAALQKNGVMVTRYPLPAIVANRVQMVQLFQNLIGNAIKFRRDDPPHVQISAENQGQDWLFIVQDNGIGIAPEHKDLIFKIFQRLHTREEYAGNGVGLAICKKIVEQHGGQIWVESEAGQGATFRFKLPAVPADMETGHADHTRDLVSR